jgi:hypothetical protein
LQASFDQLTFRRASPAGFFAFHGERCDEEVARKDLDAAIVIFERLESHLKLGRTLVFRGDDDDLARARELFQSCGAPSDPD